MSKTIKEATEAVLKKLETMSDEELAEQWESCKDGPVSYAFTGMGVDPEEFLLEQTKQTIVDGCPKCASDLYMYVNGTIKPKSCACPEECGAPVGWRVPESKE